MKYNPLDSKMETLLLSKLMMKKLELTKLMLKEAEDLMLLLLTELLIKLSLPTFMDRQMRQTSYVYGMALASWQLTISGTMASR